MNFEVGDYVLVLDEDLSGVIKKIEGQTIYLESEDGFLLKFQSNELVKKQKNESLKAQLFSKTSIDAVVAEKEQAKRKQQVKKRSKDTEGMYGAMHTIIHRQCVYTVYICK